MRQQVLTQLSAVESGAGKAWRQHGRRVAPWFQLYSNALHGDVANYPAMLNTLFAPDLSSGDLNLFTDQFFATYGIVPRRTGSAAPGFDGPLCYQPVSSGS